MDPVTAFGLAGTIVTFIDFGAKFANLIWDIYHSEGSSSPALELARVAELFEQATAAIEIPPNHQTSSSEDNLNQLANECKDFTVKLVERLRKKGLLNQQPNSKKAAFKYALRLAFHRSDLDNLGKELKGLRDRFSFLLLISLRSLAQRNLETQNEVIAALELSKRNQHNLQNCMQVIVSDLHSKTVAIDWVTNSVDTDLKSDMIEQVLQDGSSVQASGACEIVLSEQIRQRIETILIQSLSYSGMHDRQEQVLTSFETTFDWALKRTADPGQKWTHLPTWLASNDQIYWISGKAGSGKSTFMKYLSQHPDGSNVPRCHSFLSSWAKQRKLVIASFYFWAADSENLQKSRQGLFRTLLYRILSTKPALIPQAFPKQWEILAIIGKESESLSESELRAGLLRAIAALSAHNCCICLFIDGLDEFEGQPSALIDLVQAIANLGEHVKLCLASRPWVEFGDAFRQKPQLLLEDLTYNDIRFFVTSKFDDHPEFNSFKVLEPSFANQLIENVVSKGQGVFLWVALVVASLLSGFSFGDRVKDLQRRLDLLPPDLESLYEQLIERLDPFYHEHRAQLITLVESAQEALPALALYFADGGTLETLKTLPATHSTEEVRTQQVETMRRRLNSRWRGLLEINDEIKPSDNNLTIKGELIDTRPKIRYLHRTVSEFVKGSKMRAFIKQHIGANFDPHLQLCVGYSSIALPLEKSISPCLRHAREVDSGNEADMRQVIDQLQTNLHIGHMGASIYRNMLELAIVEGVTAYVVPTLKKIPYSVAELSHFLEVALSVAILNADILRALLAGVPHKSSDWFMFVGRITKPDISVKIHKLGNENAKAFVQELRFMQRDDGLSSDKE